MNDTLSSQHDDSQPMSLRERKKRLAQATIEETALRLFQQQGYEQTSIQDIANAVMMSSRTFFRYFASKEDVLLEPMHAIQSEGLRFLEYAAPTGGGLVVHPLDVTANGDIVAYEMTVEAYPDSSGTLYIELSDDPAVAVP